MEILGNIMIAAIALSAIITPTLLFLLYRQGRKLPNLNGWSINLTDSGKKLVQTLKDDLQIQDTELVNCAFSLLAWATEQSKMGRRIASIDDAERVIREKILNVRTPPSSPEGPKPPYLKLVK